MRPLIFLAGLLVLALIAVSGVFGTATLLVTTGAGLVMAGALEAMR